MGAFELGSHPQLTNIHKHLWQLEVDNHYHTCDYWLLKSRIQEHMHLQLVVGSFRNNFENEMMSSLVANKHPTNYTSSERSSMPYDYPRIPKSMQIKVADEIKEQKHEHECEQEHHASCWSENTGKYCMLQPPTQKKKKHLAVQPKEILHFTPPISNIDQRHECTIHKSHQITGIVWQASSESALKAFSISITTKTSLCGRCQNLCNFQVFAWCDLFP